MNFMFEPKKGVKWPKKLPKFDSRQDAIAVCKELCKHQFLLRSEKRGKGELGVSICVFSESISLIAVSTNFSELSGFSSPRL